MSTDIWPAVAELRRRAATTIRGLSPAAYDTRSWCGDWRVRDVCGHLVHLAEASQTSMVRDVVTNGMVPDRSLSQIARRLGECPPSELADRLEASADGRFHVVGTSPAVALGEVVVHGADMFRPLEIPWDVDPGLVVRVVPTYRWLRRVAFHARPLGRVQLSATDIEWTEGEGPQIRGRALDLLLLLANRSPVLPALSGPGLSQLP
jgi:uncharacterized protein (TIGR03083 family)